MYVVGGMVSYVPSPSATPFATFFANRGLINLLNLPKYGKVDGGFDSYLFRQIEFKLLIYMVN